MNKEERKQLEEIMKNSRKKFQKEKKAILDRAERYILLNQDTIRALPPFLSQLSVGIATYTADEFLAIYKIQKLYERGNFSDKKAKKLMSLYHEKLVLEGAYNYISECVHAKKMENNGELEKLAISIEKINAYLGEYNLGDLNKKLKVSPKIKYIDDRLAGTEFLKTGYAVKTESVESKPIQLMPGITSPVMLNAVILVSEILRNEYSMETIEIAKCISSNITMLRPLLSLKATDEDYEFLAQKLHEIYKSDLKIKSFDTKK